MLFIGMIFQYDSDQETDLIMLSSGETKEFTFQEWTDASTLPKIG